MVDRPATLVLERTKVYRDRLRKYKVLIDDAEVGEIKAGEEKTFDLLPGPHELKLKVDWMSSPGHVVTVGAGDTVRFKCGGGNAWLASIDLFRPNQWIKLDRVD